MLKTKKSESSPYEPLSNAMLLGATKRRLKPAFSITYSLNTLKLTLIVLSIMSVIFFVSPSFTFKNAEARCPNGTHKSPSGDCETVTSHEGLSRCPNGTHRSPDGDCESVDNGGNDDDNGKDDNSNPSSPNNDQSSSKTTAEGSNTLQIPRSPSSSTIPSQNTTTASPPQQQQNSSEDFVDQELAKFNSQAVAIKSNISSATFTPGNGKVAELINSVAYLRGEVSTLGAGYSILHSVEDALINKIKQSGPTAFSSSEQAYITTWVNDAMANRQSEQQSTLEQKEQPSSNLTKGSILSGLSNQSNLQQPPRSNITNSYNNADSSSDKLLTYRSPNFGFSIQYPASWKIIENATSKQIVSFHLPKNEVELSVSIDVSPSFRDTTLAKYVGKQLTLLMHNRKGFDLSESKAITIAGKNQAQEVVYTFTKKEGDKKGDQYKTDKLWMLKGDKVFTIAYFAAANKYSIYFPIAQQMIESFKIDLIS